MIKFLLERVGDNLVFPDERVIIDAQDYAAWRQARFIIKYSNDDGSIPNFQHPEDFTPIGSIEFVHEYVKRYFPNHVESLRPLNVPEELLPFAGREIVNIPLAGMNDNEIHKALKSFPSQLYVKSNYVIKDEHNGPAYNLLGVPCYGCQVSGYVPQIFSEWRIFVFKGEVQQACYYAGDPLIFPDTGRIMNMVEAYTKAPVAYTLDVFTAPTKNWDGVERTETYVMECHKFYSVGLYGFADYSKLPYMYSQTFYEMTH